MNEYIEELLNLKNDIEAKTKETVNKAIPSKYELLEKAIEKINIHYNNLLIDTKREKNDE